LEQNIAQDGHKARRFWINFFLNPSPYDGVLVSAKCFLGKALEAEDWREPDIAEWVRQCDVRETHTFASHFPYRSPQELTDENRYSNPLVEEHDQYLSDRFHVLIPQIVTEYKQSFIDQLRCIHFMGMAGNEAVMLYPSQTRRLMAERVTRIAGEIRDIPAGFGDSRFNAPRTGNLQVLLVAYTRKIAALLEAVDSDSICNLVSFAQYYFAILHPFYERCGRTSEDLMYLLFEQAGIDKRYISCTGNRASALAKERMGMINHAAEAFNQKIALHFGLDPEGIHKTPDIYKALTARYFPDEFGEVYANEPPWPFYYAHPISSILTAYHFLMESLLFDEICGFTLDNPPEPIIRLGNHLREKGKPHYAYQTHWDWAGTKLLDVLDTLLGKPLQPQ
jgi:hypothetical protein